MAALSRWLEERGKAGEWLSRPVVAEFLAGRQDARVPTGRSMTGIAP